MTEPNGEGEVASLPPSCTHLHKGGGGATAAAAAAAAAAAGAAAAYHAAASPVPSLFGSWKGEGGGGWRVLWGCIARGKGGFDVLSVRGEGGVGGRNG